MKSFVGCVVTLLLSSLLIHGAVAQTGQLQAGQVWGNPAMTTKPATATTVGAIIDRSYSCTVQGDIIFRGVSLWTCLAPGTSGLPLVSQGTGADLHYAQLANSVIATTTTNDNAGAGSIGEYIESVVSSASPVTASTGSSSNVTSISLTAGDWDVTGAVTQLPAASTSFTANLGSISTTSATLDATYAVVSRFTAFVPASSIGGHSLTRRISVAGTTTVYLVQQATFTVSTTGGYGYIFARRRR